MVRQNGDELGDFPSPKHLELSSDVKPHPAAAAARPSLPDTMGSSAQTALHACKTVIAVVGAHAQMRFAGPAAWPPGAPAPGRCASRGGKPPPRACRQSEVCPRTLGATPRPWGAPGPSGEAVRASRLRPCSATSARRSDRVASEGWPLRETGPGEETPGRAALSNTRKECQPAGANAACWRAPYGCMRRLPLAAAGREGRLVCRSHAPPAGGRLTERKTSRAACWRAPRDLMRRLLAGALQREKPGAPPAGGRRGQVELLAHAYATCDVMSGLDKGP
jgi:hypothetical protein